MFTLKKVWVLWIERRSHNKYMRNRTDMTESYYSKAVDCITAYKLDAFLPTSSDTSTIKILVWILQSGAQMINSQWSNSWKISIQNELTYAKFPQREVFSDDVDASTTRNEAVTYGPFKIINWLRRASELFLKLCEITRTLSWWVFYRRRTLRKRSSHFGFETYR